MQTNNSETQGVHQFFLELFQRDIEEIESTSKKKKCCKSYKKKGKFCKKCPL